MILGKKCTRGCRFCGVEPTAPAPPDPAEPARVAAAVRKLGLKNIVVTSVTRDDLADGGAEIWVQTLRMIREVAPCATIEALVPDFGGRTESVDRVIGERPDVFGHNLETVPSLYGSIRRGADYGRSLMILDRARKSGLITKTAIMVGLGESIGELQSAFHDAHAAGVSILFIGQYLRPTRDHVPVIKYWQPSEFKELRDIAAQIGFKVVVAGPLVRSSYHSQEQDAFLKRMRKEPGGCSGEDFT